MLQEQLIADLNRQLEPKLLEGNAESVHIHCVPSFLSVHKEYAPVDAR